MTYIKTLSSVYKTLDVQEPRGLVHKQVTHTVAGYSSALWMTEQTWTSSTTRVEPLYYYCYYIQIYMVSFFLVTVPPVPFQISRHRPLARLSCQLAYEFLTNWISALILRDIPTPTTSRKQGSHSSRWNTQSKLEIEVITTQDLFSF